MLIPTVQHETPAAQYRRAPIWLIAVSLMVIATVLVLRADQAVSPAFGQPVHQAGARGIFAFTGQLSANSYGLFMVDVDVMTVWCYEYLSSTKELRLVAARSWMFDRYLENFNCAGQSPAEIERLVQEAREQKLRDR